MSSADYSETEVPNGLTQRRRFTLFSKFPSFSIQSTKVSKNNCSATSVVESTVESTHIRKGDGKNMNDNMNGYVSSPPSTIKVEPKSKGNNAIRSEKQVDKPSSSKYAKLDLLPDDELTIDQPLLPPIIAASSHGHSKTISHKDRNSMIVLLVLYTLQGIPMGLCGSIPLILKERQVSYEGLSLFSLVSLPFSLKIVWAPIVDTFYLPSVGRRKTWLIPVQLLCGIVMILGSSYVSEWIGDTAAASNNGARSTSSASASVPTISVTNLLWYFIFLYFLMATQDIAVDGWALTMLSRENVGYASLCNSIGQSLGVFLSNQGLIALSDPLFCHQFLGLAKGRVLLTLEMFMLFWGAVFIVVTCAVWIGKKETHMINPAAGPIQYAAVQEIKEDLTDADINHNAKSEVNSDAVTVSRVNGNTHAAAGHSLHSSQSSSYSQHTNTYESSYALSERNVVISEGGDEEDGFTFVETVQQLYSIFKIPLIHLLIVILLTCKVPFAPADSVSTFKFQEYGMPKSELSLISPFLMILGFVTPMLFSKRISNTPLSTLIAGLKLKCLTSFVKYLMVQICAVVYAATPANEEQQPNMTHKYVFFYSLVVAFAAHEVAGTLVFVSFMTFFTKISDPLIGGTYMTLLNTVTNLGSIWPSSLALWLLPKLSFTLYGIQFDGYTVESFFCLFLGCVWLYTFQGRIMKLQHVNHKDWSVSGSKELSSEKEYKD